MSELRPYPFYNVPVALDDSHSPTKGFGVDVALVRITHNAEEARERVLGPMPIHAFMKKFLPASDGMENVGKTLSSTAAFTAVPKSAARSEDVHDPMLASLNKAKKQKSRCPGYSFADMPFHHTYSQIGSSKSYIACYSADNALAVSDPELTPAAALGHAEFFLDINADPDHDYFADPPATGPAGDFVVLPQDIEDKKRVERTLGYHLELVSELFARQHRVFAFTASVFGSRARLMRWDRAGCIASESFDLHTHPELLCDFLRGYSQASPEQRGFDTSIGVVDEEEERLFKDAITRRVQHELGVSGEDLANAVKKHYSRGRVFAMHVIEIDPDSDATSIRRFVVSRPITPHTGLFGGCTRGFWAWDPLTGEVFFVKDTWRTPLRELEGRVISDLFASAVRNVPAVVCHGDVQSEWHAQKTVADRHVERAWVVPLQNPSARRTLSQRIHYRLVLGTVGYSLEHFRGTEELLHATYDAFQAMQDAYSQDRRIHRDISLGNIILVREPDRAIRRGYLIDWEVSSKVDTEGLSLDRDRTGTWFYMSHRLQISRDSVHTLEDDMESLIWVVLYCALRWLPHDYDPEHFAGLIHVLFEDREIQQDGWAYGGEGKLRNLATREYTCGIEFGDAVGRWLAVAFEYRHPLSAQGKKRQKMKWKGPRHLQHIWKQFLEKVPMLADDRCEHPFGSRNAPSQSTTSLVGQTRRTPSELSSGSSVSYAKRKAELEPADSDEDEAGGRGPKRRKGAEGVRLPVRTQKRRGDMGDTQDGAGSAKRAPPRTRATRARGTGCPVANAVPVGHRYSLRTRSEAVSKYRRVHTA